MRVWVEASLFARADKRLELVKLVSSIEHGHVVLTEPLEAPELESWLDALGDLKQDCRSLLDLALEDTALLADQTQVRVVDQSTSDWRSIPPELTLRDTLALLRRPLALLVENKRRDGAFLKAVGWRYSKTLERLEEQHRLEITNGGGLGEMLQLVRECQNELERRRTFVVFDSDALAPGNPSQESQRLTRECTVAKIAYHRLHRRAAENYLPASLLPHWAKASHDRSRAQQLRRARAFERLTPEQRHHYNMKRGHKGDRDRYDRALGEALFEALEPQPMDALAEGFGTSIGDLFNHSSAAVHLEQDQQETEISALFAALLARA